MNDQSEVKKHGIGAELAVAGVALVIGLIVPAIITGVVVGAMTVLWKKLNGSSKEQVEHARYSRSFYLGLVAGWAISAFVLPVLAFPGLIIGVVVGEAWKMGWISRATRNTVEVATEVIDEVTGNEKKQ